MRSGGSRWAAGESQEVPKAFRRLEEDPERPPGGFQEALGGSNRRL